MSRRRREGSVHRRRRTRRGFTLVELLVALTVFAIALLPLAGGLASIIRLQRTNEQRLEMTNLGSDVLAELQAEATGAAAAAPAAGSDNVQGPSGRSYRRSWTVAGYPTAAPLSNIFLVSVTVSPLGSNLTLTLSTLVHVE